VGGYYEVIRAPGEQYADFPMRIAYLIDPDGIIRNAYDVTDVRGFATAILSDLEHLQQG
jgi:peroxiredoxin